MPEPFEIIQKPPELPRPFGLFILKAEISKGLRSTVYRAIDTRDNAAVALKIFFQDPNCDLQSQRSLVDMEARRLREIAHSNIIELRQHGEVDKIPFLSFPFLNGMDLDRAMADSHISSCDLLGAMVKVCRALQHAHAKGVIHRDLKPQNVMISLNHEPYVIDWGLSWKKGDKSDRLVQSIVGTPAYMSPEQARGEEQHLTEATDTYSLGAILYHLLTGLAPFVSDSTWKTLQMAMLLPPHPPHTLRENINMDLEQVVMCCLEKDPGKRYLTAEALADDLQRVIEKQPPKGPDKPGTLFGRLFGK